MTEGDIDTYITFGIPGVEKLTTALDMDQNRPNLFMCCITLYKAKL